MFLHRIALPPPHPSPEPSPPHSSQSRTDPKAFEFSKEVRNATIKGTSGGYLKRKVDKHVATNGQFDAIMIGSGMGALSCAVIMAKAGKKVLVLEQHDQIGGSLHSFHEKNFEFDTGVHYIGEMKNNTAVRFLFDQLTEGQLRWKDVDDEYDTVVLVDDKKQNKESLKVVEEHYQNGTTLPSLQVSMRSGKEPTIDSLLEAFPAEEKAIRKYYELLADVRKVRSGWSKATAVYRLSLFKIEPLATLLPYNTTAKK